MLEKVGAGDEDRTRDPDLGKDYPTNAINALNTSTYGKSLKISAVSNRSHYTVMSKSYEALMRLALEGILKVNTRATRTGGIRIYVSMGRREYRLLELYRGGTAEEAK